MTESHLFWFVHHGHEGQILVIVKAPAEDRAWNRLAQNRRQELDYVHKFFLLDAVTSLEADECVLGICSGDQWGLTVEPLSC